MNPVRGGWLVRWVCGVVSDLFVGDVVNCAAMWLVGFSIDEEGGYWLLQLGENLSECDGVTGCRGVLAMMCSRAVSANAGGALYGPYVCCEVCVVVVVVDADDFSQCIEVRVVGMCGGEDEAWV